MVFVCIDAILGFRMAGVTLTDSGVGAGLGAIVVLRPSAPVVVQHIAGEEGRLIRRALGAQTADCAGLVVDRLFRAGGGGFQILCIHGLRREVVGQLFAILSLANLADGFCGAGRRAAGAVLLVSVCEASRLQIRVWVSSSLVMRCRRRRSPHPPPQSDFQLDRLLPLEQKVALSAVLCAVTLAVFAAAAICAFRPLLCR